MPEFRSGVYLEAIRGTIGVGHTAQKQEMRNYYLATYLENGLIQVQLLDMDDQPLHIKEEIDLEEFNRRFSYQPDYYKNKKSPREKKIDDAVARGDEHYSRKEYNSAEYEYNKVLKLDEENVRANFGMGKVFLAQGDINLARQVFEKLSKIEAVFEEENKHIFNDLGIELRRLGQHEQAIAYYAKAISFVQNDENLFFNMARANLEQGNKQEARRFLDRALDLNPDMKEARQLLAGL